MTAISRLLATAALVGVFSWPAAAQQRVVFQVVCVPMEAMAAMMKRDGFAVRGIGAEDSGHLAQLWLNGDKWRMTTSFTNRDLICGVSGGEGWQSVEPKPQGDKS